MIYICCNWRHFLGYAVFFPPLISDNCCLALKKQEKRDSMGPRTGQNDVSVFFALGCYEKKQGLVGSDFWMGNEGMASTCTWTRTRTRQPTPNSGRPLSSLQPLEHAARNRAEAAPGPCGAHQHPAAGHWCTAAGPSICLENETREQMMFQFILWMMPTLNQSPVVTSNPLFV